MSHIPYHGETHTSHKKETKIIMANETPFTLRLSLLKMGKEMLDREFDVATQNYFTTLEQYAATYDKNVQDVLAATEAARPKVYTAEEVVKKARELYAFVSDNK